MEKNKANLVVKKIPIDWDNKKVAGKYIFHLEKDGKDTYKKVVVNSHSNLGKQIEFDNGNYRDFINVSINAKKNELTFQGSNAVSIIYEMKPMSNLKSGGYWEVEISDKHLDLLLSASVDVNELF